MNPSLWHRIKRAGQITGYAIGTLALIVGGYITTGMPAS